ncbi:hypothetical protein [Sulfitobacter sp. 1A15106]
MSRATRGIGRRGTWGCRIIKTIRRNGRLMELHATKGWRSYRLPG